MNKSRKNTPTEDIRAGSESPTFPFRKMFDGGECRRKSDAVSAAAVA